MAEETRHSFEVLYTETLLRDAVRTFVLRRFVIEQKSLWMLSGLMFVYAGYLVWKGQATWLVAVAGSGALMAPALAGTAWWVHLSNTLGAFRRMGAPRATVTLRDDAVEFASDMGKGELPWSSFSEIWERPDYWMVFTGRARFNVIAKAGASPEAQAFLRRQARRVLKTA